MKSLRYLLALVICLGFTGFAHASSVDFKMDVLDPNYVPGKTAILTTDSFAVDFHPCSYYGSSIPSSLSGDLCFEGINATEADWMDDLDTVPDGDGGEAWTSLALTFTNPSLGGCGIFATVPTGTTSIFSQASCTQTGSTYNVAFGGGGAIVQGEVFLIAESGDTTTTDFTGATALVSSVPEPSSLFLLSSGTMVLGMMLYTQRKRLQLGSVRS